MNYKHTPVMLKEVLEYLNPQVGQFFIDCTLGGGGYTAAIAKKVGSTGGVLAIDLDEMAIKNAEFLISNFKLSNIILANDNFKNLSKIIQKYFKNKTIKFNGIVFDLGLSSAQLQDRHRGFSFQLDASLDMAFGRVVEGGQEETENIINRWREDKLAKIIREYGEEKFSERIARAIVAARKKFRIKTTKELVEIIKKAIPKEYLYKRIHPATKTFQALRIATNDELNNLKQALPQAVDLLKKSGKIIVISYHSLEDRIVKNFFKQEARDCLCPSTLPICQCNHKAKLKILTKKIIKPTELEIGINPRARSAKMRVAARI